MATYAKTNIKVPQIIRWRIAGIPDKKIAEMLGMSGIGVAQIVGSVEYKEEEAAYLNAHVSKMDEALAGKIDKIRTEYRVAVPAAMRTLVDAVTQRKDLRTALEAAKEILDRDPDKTLTKNKDSQIAPGVPASVLEEAVVSTNLVAKAYKIDPTKVN